MWLGISRANTGKAGAAGKRACTKVEYTYDPYLQKAPSQLVTFFV